MTIICTSTVVKDQSPNDLQKKLQNNEYDLKKQYKSVRLITVFIDASYGDGLNNYMMVWQVGE